MERRATGDDDRAVGSGHSDSTKSAVTVTGATGKTGRHVAEQARAAGWRVRRAARRAPDQGEWTFLDWDDEATWRPAFAGSAAAYVLIPFNHPGAAERTPGLLRAAADAGVGKIVLLSSLDAEQAPDDSPLRVCERTLAELQVRSAVVRPTWFFDNFSQGSFAGMAREGVLRLPAGAGRIPFIDIRDIAALAVAALDPEGPEGMLPATGPEAIGHDEVAAALSAVAGRSVRYEPVTGEEFVQLLMGRGFGREYGEFLAAALDDVATGRLEIPVFDTVERVTGRRPYNVTEFAQANAALIKAAAS
jgi:uncharacterized protein YbjT (DUF2867 family)